MVLGPASHTPDRIPTPENTPFGQWRMYGWRIVAICQTPGCGHEQEIHFGRILKDFGENTSLTEQTKQRIAEKAYCIRCGAREPLVEVVR